MKASSRTAAGVAAATATTTGIAMKDEQGGRQGHRRISAHTERPSGPCA